MIKVYWLACIALRVDGATEYTELQPLLSGVHSVMRVKLVLAGEGGGARPPPLITFTLTSKVAVYASAEWADTLTLFHLYQYTCTLWMALYWSFSLGVGVQLSRNVPNPVYQ